MDKVKQVFEAERMRSKEAVIKSFGSYMEFARESAAIKQIQSSSTRRIERHREFYKLLQELELPPLTEPWWFYDYWDTKAGIELWRCQTSVEKIEIEEDGVNFAVMGYTAEQCLLRVGRSCIANEKNKAIGWVQFCPSI